MRYTGQAVAYLAFIIFIGYLSNKPTYVHLPADQALIKLSFSHAGKTIGECYQRSDEELARLTPNMRALEVCPRERSPLVVELEMDGEVLYSGVLLPSGIHRDSSSSIYQRFAVTAGQHNLRVKLKDDIQKVEEVSQLQDKEYNYFGEKIVNLKPAQVLVIDFLPETGSFIFK